MAQVSLAIDIAHYRQIENLLNTQQLLDHKSKPYRQWECSNSLVEVNGSAPFISLKVVVIEDKNGFYHRIEVGVGHTVGDNKASEHRRDNTLRSRSFGMLY